MRYAFKPEQSRFTVQAFATGLLSLLGHSPTFAVGDFSGHVEIAGDAVKHIDVRVQADSLTLLDKVSTADRAEIEGRMRGEVLEIAVYSEIAYVAHDVTTTTMVPGRYRLRINGRLSLHGIIQPHPLDGELLVYDDGVRLRGESALKLSDFRIKPVSALGGTLKLKDEFKIAFDLAALPEQP